MEWIFGVVRLVRLTRNYASLVIELNEQIRNKYQCVSRNELQVEAKTDIGLSSKHEKKKSNCMILKLHSLLSVLNKTNVTKIDNNRKLKYRFEHLVPLLFWIWLRYLYFWFEEDVYVSFIINYIAIHVTYSEFF